MEEFTFDATEFDSTFTTSTVEVDPMAMGIAVVIFLAFYAYMAYSLQVIGKKTNTPNTWRAWVPILNFFLMLKIAAKPFWWFLLMLVPLANIVVLVIVWMEMAKKRNKPGWVGIFVLVPFANLVLPGYLAFSGGGAASCEATGTCEKPMTGSAPTMPTATPPAGPPPSNSTPPTEPTQSDPPPLTPQ